MSTKKALLIGEHWIKFASDVLDGNEHSKLDVLPNIHTCNKCMHEGIANCDDHKISVNQGYGNNVMFEFFDTVAKAD